MKSKTFYI